jgi:N-acetylglucosaminyldiphosphoundecaprenol N-acetyl-beta-D-mannosaminyltransferase
VNRIIEQTAIFGYPVHLVSASQAVDHVSAIANTGTTCQVATLNPEMIMQAEDNPDLARVLKSADLALPDGAGLVWALRHRGLSVKRLPGIEFSEALLQKVSDAGESIALIGAELEILELASANLQQRYPGLRISYSHHGFFPKSEEASIAQHCANTTPRVVLVALGVPRQELWIETYRHLFCGAILVGVGGSLDVWSGKTRRAPALLRKLNLEWFYRISTQPFGKQGRLKRTYKTLPLFVVKVLFERASKSRN